MKYLRNQDVLREILLSIVIGVICTLVTYPLIGGYAILFLLLALVLVGRTLLFLYQALSTNRSVKLFAR